MPGPLTRSRLPPIPRGERPIVRGTAWRDRWPIRVKPTEPSRFCKNWRKKGAPDWVDRSWLQIGLIRETEGRFADAVEAFSMLERVAPVNALRAEAGLHRGLALARLDRGDEAEAILNPLAASGAETIGPRAGLELATIQLEHHRAEAAFSTLEKALERYPKCAAVPALLFRTAEALQKQKKLAEAEARFLKVAEAFPEDAWADDALQRAAQTALERGDFAAARRVAGTFSARYGQSGLKNEVRVIEARLPLCPETPRTRWRSSSRSSAATRDGGNGAGPAASESAAKRSAPPLPPAVVERPGMIWRWRTGRSADRLKVMPSSSSSPRRRQVLSRRMLNSWSASRTWMPDDMRKQSRYWSSTWPPILEEMSPILPWLTW